MIIMGKRETRTPIKHVNTSQSPAEFCFLFCRPGRQISLSHNNHLKSERIDNLGKIENEIFCSTMLYHTKSYQGRGRHKGSSFPLSLQFRPIFLLLASSGQRSFCFTRRQHVRLPLLPSPPATLLTSSEDCHWKQF